MPRERALDLLMEFLPVPRDYEEVLRDRRVLCRPPAEHPSGVRAPDPNTRLKKRASGLHVLLLQAGQVASPSSKHASQSRQSASFWSGK